MLPKLTKTNSSVIAETTAPLKNKEPRKITKSQATLGIILIAILTIAIILGVVLGCVVGIIPSYTLAILPLGPLLALSCLIIYLSQNSFEWNIKSLRKDRELDSSSSRDLPGDSAKVSSTKTEALPVDLDELEEEVPQSLGIGSLQRQRRNGGPSGAPRRRSLRDNQGFLLPNQALQEEEEPSAPLGIDQFEPYNSALFGEDVIPHPVDDDFPPYDPTLYEESAPQPSVSQSEPSLSLADLLSFPVDDQGFPLVDPTTFTDVEPPLLDDNGQPFDTFQLVDVPVGPDGFPLVDPTTFTDVVPHPADDRSPSNDAPIQQQQVRISPEPLNVDSTDTPTDSQNTDESQSH